MVLLRERLSPEQLAEYQTQQIEAVDDFKFEYIGRGTRSKHHRDAFTYPSGYSLLTEDKQSTERYNAPKSGSLPNYLLNLCIPGPL